MTQIPLEHDLMTNIAAKLSLPRSLLKIRLANSSKRRLKSKSERYEGEKANLWFIKR